ncbi:MAG: hypothetical protein U0930_03590 [Pirellulales bacterium]
MQRKLANAVVLTLAGTTIAGIRKIGAPAKAREEIDVTCIGDALEQFLDNEIQKAGQLKLDLIWQPGDTNCELLDTLIDDSAAGNRVGAWVIQWRMFTPIKFDAFSGFVLDLTPPELDAKGLITRTANIRLTTKITRTTGT